MSSAMLSAISAPILYPAIFVNIGFASGPAYVWSGVGSMTWNGNTYTGVGDLGSISVIEEASSVEAKGIEVSLSGIDPTMLADALEEHQLGLPMVVYLALYDAPGGSIIASPLIAWQGRTDQPTITISGETATISIRGESRILDQSIAPGYRYDNDTAQIFQNGELGFLATSAIQEMTINFGVASIATQNI